MTIVLTLLGALAVSVFAGFGLVGLMAARLPVPGRWLVPITGYAFTQALFFPAYFLCDGNAGWAVALVLFVAGVIDAVYLWRFVRAGTPWREFVLAGEASVQAKMGAIAVVVIALAAWPYFLGGWGSYQHTGNPDIFDSLRGHDAYLSGEIARGMRQNVNAWVSSVDEDALRVLVGMQPQRFGPSPFAQVWAGDVLRLQYSSVAFWAEALGIHRGMDAFMIQALLLVLLTLQGVVALVRFGFGGSERTALAAGSAAVMAHFYLVSYLNGHQGSLMYGAAMPFVLALGLGWIDRGAGRWQTGGLMALLLAFVFNCYPFPTPFILLPLALYALHRRMLAPRGHWRRMADWLRPADGGWSYARLAVVALAVVALCLAATLLAWSLADPLRDRAAAQFRSWGTMFNYVGLFQYWGLWPSSVSYGPGLLSEFIRRDSLVIATAVLSAAMLTGVLYAYGVAAAGRRTFLWVFAAAWVVFFVTMRFVVADPYYLYKFLYTNYFIMVAGVALGLAELFRRAGRVPRVALGGLLGIWCVSNLALGSVVNAEVSHRLYNRDFTQFRKLLAIPHDKLAQTFVDIPERSQMEVVRHMLVEEAVAPSNDKLGSTYLLRMKDEGDVVVENEAPPVWQSNYFRLVPTPERDFLYVNNSAYWGPEHSPGGVVYRWVGDRRDGLMSVTFSCRSAEPRYFRVCATPGPGVDFEPLDLEITDGAGRSMGTFRVDGDSCKWFDDATIRKAVSPITFKNTRLGKPVSLVDSRRLDLKVFGVGLVDERRYDLPTLRALTDGKDILSTQARAILAGAPMQPGAVFVGTGWYSYERFGGATFRWLGPQGDIVLAATRGHPGTLVLDAEVGPGAGKAPLALSLADESGREVAHAQAVGRGKVTFAFTPERDGLQTYQLRAAGPGLKIRTDPRMLNLRVFGLSWADGGATPR